MHESRNWYLTRDQVEDRIKAALGLKRIVWLGQGLAEDSVRDPERMYYGTDGHADLFLAFIGQNRALMLKAPEDDPNAPQLANSRAILTAAGIEIVDFPYMSGFMDEGNWIIAPYMNFYFCNGGVIVPVAGEEPDKDQEVLGFLARLLPNRQVVSVLLRAGPRQGGAIHCMTMQVPARP
jgi:agmatine deiminase